MNRAKICDFVIKELERQKQVTLGRWSLEEIEEVYDKEGCQGLLKVFEVVGCK